MNKREYYIVSFLYFIIILAFGVFFPLNAKYVTQDLGYSFSKLSLMLSVGLIFSTFVVPFINSFADISRKYKLIFLILLTGSSISFYMLNYTSTFTHLLITYLVLELFRSPILSQLDSITNKLCEKEGFNYGSIRRYGSLGYIIGALIGSLLLMIFTIDQIIYTTPSIVLLFSMVFAFFFLENDESNTEVHHKVSKSDFKSILKNRNFLILLLLSGLVFGFTNQVGGYLASYLSIIGASDSQVSLLAFISAFPELFFMGITIKLINKGKYKFIYLMSILSILRWSFVYLATDIYTVLALSSLHGVIVSIYFPLQSYIIQNEIPRHLRTIAYGLVFAIMNLISLSYQVLFGYLSDNISINSTFIVGIISSVVVLLLTVLINKEIFKKNRT